jgi:prepilin-type N-terminal cleavage/methylation domain-containing protein
MERGRKGFTLVEMVLALALAGLFMYGAAYSFQRLVPKFQLQSGIWEVTSGLSQARFRAIMSGEPVRVRFVPSGFVFERYDEAAKIWRTARTASLPGVAVRANNAPVFHPQGTVSDLASITVSNALGTFRITIAITGRVKTTRVA